MFNKLLLTLPFVLGVLSNPVQIRATVPDNFTLYAYGSSSSSGIGGLPVLALDGLAYIVDLTTETSAQNVTFDLTSSTFTGTTSDGVESLLYIPSTSGPVGFTTTTSDSSKVTSGFGFYGGVAYCYTQDAISTLWYAVPTEQSGLWQLTWDSDSDAAIVVALRDNAPSS
ncbi:hypothetical protein SUNI508_09914 [Seiridium unicorne]|uniref:Uncharacterized protein n=1 Tax=Seiridium unicorne TaxID=138068 RepID=A0ABR2UMT4_9PEZI